MGGGKDKKMEFISIPENNINYNNNKNWPNYRTTNQFADFKKPFIMKQLYFCDSVFNFIIYF